MTNNDLYDFISKEISKHPELQPVTKEELMKHEDDFDYWDELSEHLDCLRICDACHRPIIEGFCIDGGREHYCSEKCLYQRYSEEEYMTMNNDGEGNSYWTIWWE